MLCDMITHTALSSTSRDCFFCMWEFRLCRCSIIGFLRIRLLFLLNWLAWLSHTYGICSGSLAQCLCYACVYICDYVGILLICIYMYCHITLKERGRLYVQLSINIAPLFFGDGFCFGSKKESGSLQHTQTARVRSFQFRPSNQSSDFFTALTARTRHKRRELESYSLAQRTRKQKTDKPSVYQLTDTEDDPTNLLATKSLLHFIFTCFPP